MAPVKMAPVKKGEASLVKPDLEGLWSSSLLGGANGDGGMVAWLQGAAVLLCLTLSWGFGMATPFWALYKMWHGGAAAAAGEAGALAWDGDLAVGTAFFVLLAWPYVLPVKPWPMASRFWLSAASYFEGGCSMSWEKPRDPNDLSTPQMHCYHPHGIFTLGLILNSGIRSSAAEHAPGTPLWRKYVGGCGRVPFVGLAAEQLVQMPVFRHVMVLWTGNIVSASIDRSINRWI